MLPNTITKHHYTLARVKHSLPLSLPRTNICCLHPAAHVWKNSCEKIDGLDHMSETECRAYMNTHKLKAHNPFAGSWGGDCRKCMRSGTMVAYNKHPNPTCKSSWLTVCGGKGGELSLQRFLSSYMEYSILLACQSVMSSRSMAVSHTN